MGKDSLNLRKLREKIDKIDEELLNVLSKRKDIVEKVLRAKKQNNIEIYQPKREEGVIKRLASKASQKKLDKEFVQRFFKYIISYFREKEVGSLGNKFERIAVLGPKDTFSDIAAKKFLNDAGLISKIIYYSTIPDVFDAVLEKEVELGVVPFENSTEGSVRQTLDELFKSHIHIFYAFALPVHQILASKGKSVKEIISHEQSFGQCAHFLRANYPDAKITFASSNVQAMLKVRNSKKQSLTAIGPKEAALKNDLKILEENIEDNKNNVTKFVVIKPEIQEEGDITSVALYGHDDRPGLLYDTLGIFAKRKINLTRIESRPAKSRLGNYVFYIDFEGELKDPKIKRVLEEVKKQSFKIKTFGTYKEIK